MFLIDELSYDYLNYNYLNLLSQLTTVNLDYLDENKKKNFLLSLNDNHKIFIAIDSENNEVIGTITVLIENKIIHDFGLVGHIEDVVVDTNYRGKNIGKSLINYAVDYCKTKKCYKVILDCDEYNSGFYKKCGFNIKGLEMSKYFI